MAAKEFCMVRIGGALIALALVSAPAVGFYRALGGKTVARSSERFGTRVLDKVAFAWNS